MSCNDDIDVPSSYSKFEVIPTISKYKLSTMRLLKKDEAQSWDTIKWQSAQKFEDMNLHFFVQVDKKGTNFSKPIEFRANNDLQRIITKKELNAALLTANYKAGDTVTLEMRIRSFVHTEIPNKYSNVLSSYKVIPYLDFEAPKTLYLSGNALDGVISLEKGLPFYKSESADIFTKYVYLEKDSTFKLVDKIDNKGNKYGVIKFSTISANIIGVGDSIKFTGNNGLYKITANYTTSELNVTAVTDHNFDYPKAYIVGSFTGWDGDVATPSTPMTREKEGVYSVIATVPVDAQFKFVFGLGWNINFSTIGKVGNTGILAPNGDNGNISFDGGGIKQKITINLKLGTYTIEKAIAGPDVLYIVGASAEAVGWDANKALPLYSNDGTFTIYTKLLKNNTFRFLSKKGEWDAKYNYPYFTSSTSNLENANDGDKNMKVTSNDSVYKVIADFNTNKISAIAAYSDNQAHLYMVGNFNGWDADAAPEMTKIGDEYSYDVVLSANAEFKFIKQQNWDGEIDWGNINGNGNTGFIGPKGSCGNITFTGDGTSTYTVKVNLKAGTYSITKK